MEKSPEVFRQGNAWVQNLKQPTAWLWEGVVAEDAVTLLSAPEKVGKTTLLSLLLDRRRAGGQLLGRPVRPGRTILCSEERPQLWAARQPPLDFGNLLEFHQPVDDPTPRGWRRFIDHLLELPDCYFDLLVIDTVMSFLPAAQNNPTALRKALSELHVVSTMLGGVLLLHQTSAARTRTRARGPLPAFADILIDMQMPGGDRFTRRRDFYGVGRYPGTVQYVAAELNAAGTDYELLSDAPPQSTLAPGREAVQRILRESPVPLTHKEILARWPAGVPLPHTDSLWRVLAKACESGALVRTGAGTKAEAYCFTVPQLRSCVSSDGSRAGTQADG